MQDAQNAAGAAGSGGELPGSRVSVGTIALAVLVLAGIVSGVIILTRDSGAPEAPPTGDGGAFRLSDEEAIDRYLELEQLIVQAYETRDLSMVSSIYTPNSKGERSATREINRLLRQDVRVFPSFDTEEVSVTSNTSNEIALQEVVVVDATFVNAKGEDVTDDEAPHRQVVHITLKPLDGTWLISRSVIKESNPIGTGGAS